MDAINGAGEDFDVVEIIGEWKSSFGADDGGEADGFAAEAFVVVEDDSCDLIADGFAAVP